MQVRFSKGLKPFLLKTIGLLIGICYLLNPLHDQINNFLHTVSHTIEIGHAPMESMPTGDSNHYSHDYHEHTSHDGNHDHFLIDLFDMVFSATEGHNGSNESLLTLLKIDKHVILFSSYKITLFSYQVEHLFLNPTQKIEGGHSRLKEKPPKVILC